MANVLIVYSTQYGNTQKMALSVEEGVKTVPNATAQVKPCSEVTAEDLLACDALVLGSPVHMGSADWKVKKFIDEICSGLWMKDALIGKVGAVFASGGGFGSSGGGCEIAMLGLLNNLAELGMLIVPLPKNTEGYAVGGLQWGPYGRSAGIHMEQTGVQPEGLKAAYHHGANIARVALHIRGHKLLNP